MREGPDRRSHPAAWGESLERGRHRVRPVQETVWWIGAGRLDPSCIPVPTGLSHPVELSLGRGSFARNTPDANAPVDQLNGHSLGELDEHENPHQPRIRANFRGAHPAGHSDFQRRAVGPVRRMKRAEDDPDFMRFYSAYPRREARADAFKAWQQTARIRPLTDELLRVVAVAARVLEWTSERRRFIPLPATWLRGERWADELEAPIAVPQAKAVVRTQAEIDRLADLERRSREAGDDAMQRLRREAIARGAGVQLVKDGEPRQIGLLVETMTQDRKRA